MYDFKETVYFYPSVKRDCIDDAIYVRECVFVYFFKALPF